MSDLRWLLDNVPEDSIEEHALTIEGAIKENAELKRENAKLERIIQAKIIAMKHNALLTTEEQE